MTGAQVEQRSRSQGGHALPANLRDWRWRTGSGAMLRPCVMETRHLHHTLVMVWHHVMPEAARVRPYYRAYSFGPFYSEAYMRQSVTVMGAELSSRYDLSRTQAAELAAMSEYLRGEQPRVGMQKRIKGETE